ncbi:MAG: hypothetical protein ABIQ16_21525, partial [Polyangiaceae bacterium]
MSMDPYSPPRTESRSTESAPVEGVKLSEDEADEIARRLKSLNNRSLAIGGLGLALQGGASAAVPGQPGAMLRFAGAILL